MLEGLAESEDAAEKEKYAAFWKDFGVVLKEGIGEDHANRERLTKLYRFSSTHDDGSVQNVSLPEYVSRMKEGQEAIYYVTADTLATAKNSPQLEIFKKKGIEVLLLTDRVDEWLLSHLYEYDGHPLQSVAKGSVDLGKLADEAEKKQAEEAATAFKPTLERLKISLKDRAKDVRVTTRLVDSPACLVVEEGDMSGHLARCSSRPGRARRRRSRSSRSTPSIRSSRSSSRASASTTSPASSSTRRCSPKAASSRTRPRTCGGSTRCCWLEAGSREARERCFSPGCPAAARPSPRAARRAACTGRPSRPGSRTTGS
jgi:HSP90 family molecular chaperone